MIIRAFITHKEAENYTDCQDRFSINSDTKSISLSDGMSQSIFQKYWAEILVNAYTSNLEWYPDLNSVRSLSPFWREKVDEYVEKQKEEGKNTWRVERNLSDGLSAGATFLGIRFNRNTWCCQILGDSCLILINDQQITDIISSEKVSSFNNYPDYYDSNPVKDGKGKLQEFRGQLKSNCAIVLVTDPFSDFLSRNKGKDGEKDIIKQLLDIKTHDEFELVVKEWREMGMHNDDSTLIIILPDESDKFDVEFADNIDHLIEDEQAELATSLIENSPTTIEKEIQLCSEEETTNSSQKINEDSKDDTPEKESNHQSSINWANIFNDEFAYSLEVTIHTNLRRFMILKKQRKEIAQAIANEIKTLIHHTLMK